MDFQNEVLKERINHLGKEENKLSQEIELRKNTQLENMKMSTDFNSMKNEHSRLSKLNKEMYIDFVINHCVVFARQFSFSCLCVGHSDPDKKHFG